MKGFRSRGCVGSDAGMVWGDVGSASGSLPWPYSLEPTCLKTKGYFLLFLHRLWERCSCLSQED